jgi:DNA (cytosine-5)-methyltransferase 1
VVTSVDLFCGLGGLTHGLIRGGIRVVAGVDSDPHCRYPYETNNAAPFIERDVGGLAGEELGALFGRARLRLLAGCAPCQPYSTYSRKGRRARGNSAWELVSDFARLTRETQPEFVTMENVPQLRDHPVFEGFLEALDGYHVWWGIVECARFGVPQTRKRLVVLASRLGKIMLASPSGPQGSCPTVREAISKLPALQAGCSDPEDPIHTASSLSELNLRRIRCSKPGGTWRDWDPGLVATCHRRISGQTYPSVYGRMEWDAPAPTITTQCFGFGNGRFGHPEQDRAISLREAALLQTFPRDYCFLPPGEPVRFNQLGRLIGNAVPVRIGEVIAQSLLDHLQR